MDFEIMLMFGVIVTTFAAMPWEKLSLDLVAPLRLSVPRVADVLPWP